MSITIGSMVGRYKILELLGEGGMATVYKAEDTVLERFVAIKVIRTEQFPPSMLNEMMRRFEREAKALAKLSHPNIVHVHDYGEFEGAPYLVMEYLPSGTLKNRPESPMPWREALNLIIPIAWALAYAHEHGVIHRDIKPGNILLTDKGTPMLSDFGIAKVLGKQDGNTITGTGMSIGTPEYMAPEQWNGEASPQSDIYSLGAMLYELLTGRKPFQADTPVNIMLKQMNEPAPRATQFVPDLPVGLEDVIVRALAKNPADRYANMTEMAETLESFRTPTMVQQTVRLGSTGQLKTMLASEADKAAINANLPAAGGAARVETPTPVRKPTPKPAQKPTPAPARKRRLWIPLGALGLVACVGLVLGATVMLRNLRKNVPLTGAIATATNGAEVNSGVVPGGTSGKIRVLWDTSHGPRQDANSVPYTPEGMYQDLARLLQGNDFTVTSGDLSNLDSYDVLVISEASGSKAYTSSEVDAIEKFVRTDGHGLLLMTDTAALENLDYNIAQRFNLGLGEATINGPTQLMNSPFLNGVSSVVFVDGGGMFQVTAPAVVAAQDAQGNAVIAYCECDQGRVVAVGDTNLWDKNGLPQGDNQKFAINVFEWLGKVGK